MFRWEEPIERSREAPMPAVGQETTLRLRQIHQDRAQQEREIGQRLLQAEMQQTELVL